LLTGGTICYVMPEILSPQKNLAREYEDLRSLSYRKGKPPHQYTKNPQLQKLLGTWRVDFQWSGFFKMSIFEMEITAAEGKDLTGKMTAQKLRFFFDDKKEGDDFNVAFRQAIKLCSGD
jgi:hypothetical protein